MARKRTLAKVAAKTEAVAAETAKAAAAALGIPTDSVALGSTGEIGRQLPIDRIRQAWKR